MNRRFSTADENLCLQAYDAAKPRGVPQIAVTWYRMCPLNSLA